MKSTDVIQPLAMGSAFAINGDKEIPAQTEAGTNTSTINDGFLPKTSLPIESGGQNPQRTDFNGMFYLSTDQRFFLQNGGYITYSADVVSAIGGYPQGAILGYTDSYGNFGLVQSLIDDNAYNFVQNPSYINDTYWKKILLGQDVLNVLDPNFILLPSSGTINLTTNSINYINPSGAITFVLPNVSPDTKLNQILIQVYLSTVYSINVGTTHYFNGKTPNMSTTGMYNLIFEYDESLNYWVCGWLRKS